MSHRSFASCLAFTIVLAAPSLAHAQEQEVVAPSTPAPAPAPAPVPVLVLPAPPSVAAEAPAPHATVPPHYDYFRFGVGFRIGSIDDPGFDTFAKNDVLAQVSLEGTYAFYTKGKLAIASGLAWDVGSRSAGARGLTTRLLVNRLTVPVEARWYFAPWLNGFVKVAPGGAAYAAHIEDPSSPASLEDTSWVLAGDLSGGATVRLAGGNDHDVRRPRLWLTTELGYGITSSHSLRPRPNRDEKDVLGADESTRLGSLALNGVFWRTGLAVSF
jgi:hypothetical protein